jgi:hypothetical protein
LHPEGGVESGYQKNVVSIGLLVDGLGTLLERDIRDDRRWGPNVDFSISCVLRYPQTARVLFAADDPMTLSKPLFRFEYLALSRDRRYPRLDELEHTRGSLNCCSR